MKAMILAAGRGQRMGALTANCPKPLLEVGGKPLIVWHIERLREAGFRELVINTGYLGERLSQALGDGTAFGVSIVYSSEPEQALETGGGIFQALPLLDSAAGWFAVVNGDVWTDLPFSQLRDFGAGLHDENVAGLFLVRNPAHNAGGDFSLLADGRVVSEDVGSGQRLTFSGLGVYRAALFEGCEPGRFALAPLLRSAMARGHVAGRFFAGDWRDIGTPERLQALDADLSLGS